MSTTDTPPLPPDTTPPVHTPDLKELGGQLVDALRENGLWNDAFASLWASIKDGLIALIGLLVGGFDELLSIFVPAITAGQGIDTSGFYDLTAAILNDLLGVNVSGPDLAAAHDERGLIPAMQQVGNDFLNTLLNEFVTGTPGTAAGEGSYGLPGPSGSPLTPKQGVDAARAFLGFVMSFAVRQGNIAVLTDALSFHWLGQVREYGEMMARNLGLSRLSRRVLTPIIQTTIVTPLQQALNFQYRPHIMDAKQLAGAYIRGEIDREIYLERLQLQGYSDKDIQILIDDTVTRLNVEDLLLLHDNGILTDLDLHKRVRGLGFDQNDLGILIQARQYRAVQRADGEYATMLGTDLVEGRISSVEFTDKINTLRIPKLEIDALTRNAVHRAQVHRRHLSLGFLKKAYLNASITLDEYLAHATELGFDQDDVDILEQELLVEQKDAAAKVKAKAVKIAKKVKSTSTPVPPAPPVSPGG